MILLRELFLELYGLPADIVCTIKDCTFELLVKVPREFIRDFINLKSVWNITSEIAAEEISEEFHVSQEFISFLAEGIKEETPELLTIYEVQKLQKKLALG